MGRKNQRFEILLNKPKYKEPQSGNLQAYRTIHYLSVQHYAVSETKGLKRLLLQSIISVNGRIGNA